MGKKKKRLKGTKVCLGKKWPKSPHYEGKNLKSPYLKNNLQQVTKWYNFAL